jgi:hypothetical protein
MSHILNEMTDITRCAVSVGSAVPLPAVDFRVAHSLSDGFDVSNKTNCRPSHSAACWLALSLCLLDRVHLCQDFLDGKAMHHLWGLGG